MGACGANKPVAGMRILRALRNAPARYVRGGPRIAQLSEGNGRDGLVEPGTSEHISREFNISNCVHLVDENPIATLDQAAELGEDPALLPLIPPRLLLAARCGEDADNSVSEDVDIASVDRVDEKDTLLRLFRAQLGGRDCLSWAVENIVHVEAKRNAVDMLLRKLASLRRSFSGGEPMEM